MKPRGELLYLDKSTTKKITKLIEELENHEDVQNVYHNADL